MPPAVIYFEACWTVQRHVSIHVTPDALPIAAARQPDSVLAPFTALATSIYLHASSGAAQVAGGTGVGHGGVGIGNVDHLQGSSLAMSNAVPDGGGGGGGSLGSVGVTAVGVGGVVGGVVGSVGGGGASGGAAGSGNAGGGGIRFRETVGALLC